MQRHVNGWWDCTGEGNVGRVIDDDGCLVNIVPAVVVDIDTVEVIALGHWPVAERSVFIGEDINSKVLSKSGVNEFNGGVGQNIASESHQRVSEDSTGHRHGQIIGWNDANFDGVGQEHFFSIVQLSNHVVGSRQETGFVK